MSITDIGICRATRFSHGEIDCALCHDLYEPGINGTLKHDSATMIPGAFGWGAIDPKVIVLGFSKGANQSAQMAKYLSNGRSAEDFLGIPFAGTVMRERLTRLLRAVGLLGPAESVSDRLGAEEKVIHWGSVVRCGVGVLRPSAPHKPSSSMPLILEAMSGNSALEGTFRRCIERHIGALKGPKIVVMLNNSRRYVQLCFAALRTHYPALEWKRSTTQERALGLWLTERTVFCSFTLRTHHRHSLAPNSKNLSLTKESTQRLCGQMNSFQTLPCGTISMLVHFVEM
jgi:hypothetical protein